VSARSSQRRAQVGWVARAAVIVVTASVVVVLASALHVSQARSERQLSERFEARGELAASFAATWVEQLIDQERRVAVDSLSGTTQLDERLASVVEVFEFPVAALMDSQGRALALHPRAPELIGVDMASRYQHLATAAHGQPAVSSVVNVASGDEPAVAFAAPFDTPSGRRVFSGTYHLHRTPLGAFLAAVSPIPQSTAYIVDAVGTVVTTGAVHDGGEQPRGLPTALAAAHRRSADGTYTDGSGKRHYFTSQRVEGTPWSLVVTAPLDTLFAPVHGPERTVPWIGLGLVALLAGSANWLFLRLFSGQDRLRALNAALDSSARTDQLTNLPNRRHLDQSLAAALSAGARHNLPVSVLVMDLDHFKQVNDTYGHSTGDRVLEQVAGILKGTMRDEDLIGRWGGEEFLAVLPHTDEPGATRIAERIRQIVQDTPYTNKARDRHIVTTMSIGCATSLSGGDNEDLVHRADQALYRAKAEGRNSVSSTTAR